MGEFPCPVQLAETNRKKKDSSSFLVRTQPMKSHGHLVYTALPTSFALYKSGLLPLPCRDLHMALGPQIAILC